MDLKVTVSPSFIWSIWQDMYHRPYTLTTCRHSFCQACLQKVREFSILKPNYSPEYFRCPLWARITDTPTGDFTVDLPYAEDIELAIREWKEKEFEFDSKYSVADICRNHLKLLEKFCLDDNHFICWMWHNFNYSDDHRGHKVVSLPEAYKIIKKQSVVNLELLEKMQNLTANRLKYISNARKSIGRDLSKAK